MSTRSSNKKGGAAVHFQEDDVENSQKGVGLEMVDFSMKKTEEEEGNTRAAQRASQPRFSGRGSSYAIPDNLSSSLASPKAPRRASSQSVESPVLEGTPSSGSIPPMVDDGVSESSSEDEVRQDLEFGLLLPSKERKKIKKEKRKRGTRKLAAEEITCSAKFMPFSKQLDDANQIISLAVHSKKEYIAFSTENTTIVRDAEVLMHDTPEIRLEPRDLLLTMGSVGSAHDSTILLVRYFGPEDAHVLSVSKNSIKVFRDAAQERHVRMEDTISASISSCSFASDIGLLVTTTSSSYHLWRISDNGIHRADGEEDHHVMRQLSNLDLTEGDALDPKTSKGQTDPKAAVRHKQKKVTLLNNPKRVPLMKCAISPSGSLLAFAGADLRIYVEFLETLEPQSSDAEFRCSVLKGQSVSLPLRERGHSERITCLVTSHDSRFVISGSEDKTLRVWDVRTLRMQSYLQGHTSAVTDVVVTKNTEYAISASLDATIRVFDIDTGDQIFVFFCAEPVNALFLRGDQRYLVSGSTHVRVWDFGNIGQGGCQILENWGDTVTSVTGTLDSHYLVVTSLDPARSLSVYRQTDLLECATLPNFPSSGATLSKDGLRMAATKQHPSSPSEFHEVVIFDILTLKDPNPQSRSLTPFPSDSEPISRLKFSPVEYSLAVGGKKGSISVYDTLQMTVMWQVRNAHGGEITAIEFVDGEKFLVTASEDAKIKIWDFSKGTLLRVYPEHEARVTGLSVLSSFSDRRDYGYSPDPEGPFIASCSYDKTIRLFSLQSCVNVMSPIVEFRPIWSIAASYSLSHDSVLVVAGLDNGSAKIFLGATGECLFVLNIPVFDPIGHMYIVEDQQLLVIGSLGDSNALFVWELGRMLYSNTYSFDFLDEAISADRFSPNQDDRLGNLKQALAARPSSLLVRDRLGATYFHHLIPSSDKKEYHRVIAGTSPNDIIPILCATRVPLMPMHGNPLECSLLGVVMKTNRLPCIKPVVDRIIAFGERAAHHRSRGSMHWWIRLELLSDQFTLDVMRLVKKHSSLAVSLLNGLALSLASEAVDVDYKKAATLPKSQEIVQGTQQVDPLRLWQQYFSRQKRDLLAETLQLKDDFATSSLTITSSRIVPIPSVAAVLHDKEGNPLRETFLECLVNSGNVQILGNPMVYAIVKHKWKAYGERLLNMDLYIYLTLLFALVAVTILIGDQPINSLSFSGMSSTDISTFALCVYVLLLTVREANAEITQALFRGRKSLFFYLRDPWNFVQFLQIATTVTAIGAFWGGSVAARPLLAVAVYLRWLGLLFYLQAYHVTGSLVRMIFQIIVDIRWFILILGIVIFGAANAFFTVLQNKNTEFNAPGSSLFTVYNMLLLTNIDTDWFSNDGYSVFLWCIFVFSTFLVPIILLNLLIALMSDSFERIQTRSEYEFMMLRSRILLEQEMRFSSSDYTSTRLFPKWLHVLLPRVFESDDGQWQGMLHDIKRHMTDELETIEGVSRTNSSQLNQLEGRLASLEENMYSLTLKMDNLIAALESKTSRAS